MIRIRFISTFLITLWILIIPSISLGNPPDTLIIRGNVFDYGGNPIPNCSVAFNNSRFESNYETVTDSLGKYYLEVPRGRYMSIGACRMDEYQHTASASLPDSLKRLEWWGWNICAEKDSIIDIRYNRMEAYGISVFTIPGASPAFQIFVRPMSLTRYQKWAIGQENIQHGMDLSNVRGKALLENAKATLLAPPPDLLNVKVFIDGEEVPVLLKQEIKEYQDAMTYGNAYLLTVGLPKWENGLTTDTIRFRIELEDLENGDKGEAIYDYTFTSYK